MTDVAALMAGTEEDIAHVLTAAMDEAAELLREDWKQAIEEAGLGSRLARTVRAKVYPMGQASLDPAAFVHTKAPKIIDAFDRGVTIRARNKRWLAFPTPAAGPKRISPLEWERKTGLQLRFVPLRGGKSALLVTDNARLSSKGRAQKNQGYSRKGGSYTRLTGRATIVVFQLSRSVKEKKLLDLDALADRGAARVPALIDKHWATIPPRDAPMLIDDRGRPIGAAPKPLNTGATW